MIRVKAGVAAIGVILLLSSCPPFRLVSPVYGQIGIHCVDLGQSHPNYHSIGAWLFKPKDLQPLGPFHFYVSSYKALFKNRYGSGWESETCPRPWEINWSEIQAFHFIEYCPQDITIKAYLVRQNGRVLKGWLHFEVEFTDTSDEIEWIYVQTRDEYFNAIGEIVTNEDEQCSSSNKNLISPSKYQVFPCTATGLREAKGIFMAKRSQYANNIDGKYLPKKDLKRGIHFTWRLNEYWCNRHKMFRLDAHVWTTKKSNIYRRNDQVKVQNINGVNIRFCETKTAVSVGVAIKKIFNTFLRPFNPNPPPAVVLDKNKQCRQKRKHTEFWLHPKWFGSADIKTEGPLDCTVRAIDFSSRSGAVTLTPDTWLHSSSKMTAGTDYETENQRHKVSASQTLNKNCQVVAGPNAPSFGGRCLKHYSIDKQTSTDFFQGCIQDPKAPEFNAVDTKTFIDYTDYVDHIIENRLKTCEQTCDVPNITNPDDLKDIRAFTKKNTTQARKLAPVHFKVFQNARLQGRADVFFQTRKYHGNLCIFITMFLLPVSNFLIRYYKETFMHNHYLGCAPWFWVHLFVCFAIPTMYRSSYSALQESALNYGTSKTAAGIFHRGCGHFFVVVFLLMVVLGAVRPFIRGSRLVCMTMHSITGFVLYLLALTLIISSTSIPASPTLHTCDPKDHLPTGTSFTAKMVVAWFFIDLVFHLLLTAFQFYVDKKCKITRAGCGFPLVPMLPAKAGADLRGSKVRKIVLVVYVSLSLLMTFVTIGELFWDDDQKECTLGPMTCNLSEYRPNQKSSPFGCNMVSLRYYALVYSKYEIKFNESDV